MNKLKDFLNLNTKPRENHEHAQFFQYVSLLGGSYYIWNIEIPKFHTLLSNKYNYSPGNIAALHCLCERMMATFTFFLDIEDKSLNIEFDERIIDTIINNTRSVFYEITAHVIDRVYVARNNAFEKHKIHLIFKGTIVNKEIYKYVLSRLKLRLYGQLANCIDEQCSSGLRMIGAKKNIKDRDGIEDINEWRREKGWYIPSEVFILYGGIKPYPNPKKFTPQTFVDFSIHNLENKPIIELKKTSLFYQLELSPNVIREFPPQKFINEIISLIEPDDWARFIKFLPKTYCGEKSYYRWLMLGKFIHSLDNGSREGLILWTEVSRNDYYTKEQTEYSCASNWNNFETDEDYYEGQKEVMFKILKKYCSSQINEFMKSKVSDFKKKLKEHKISVEKYQDSLADVCISAFYEDKESIVKIGEYVDPCIFSDAKKYTFVRAPLGSGKTTAIIQYIKETWDENLPVIWLSARKTFTSDLIEKVKGLGFVSYEQVGKGYIINKRVVIQYESLCRLKNDAYSNCLFISDEIESIFSQMVAKTNKDRDIENIATFQSLCSMAKKVIFADAFLSNRPKEICQLIENELSYSRYEYKSSRTRNLVQLKTTRKWNKDEKEYTSFLGRDKWESILKRDIEDGKKVYVFCSSKHTAKQLYDSFSKICSCLLYTSETDEKTDNVNELWSVNQVIITTSKITIGIDCQVEFDSEYAYINAQILTRDAIQSLFRVRNVKGHTYICFDNKARIQRNSVCLKTIYDNLISNVSGIQKTIGLWKNKNKFTFSLDDIRARVQLSCIQEQAFNTTTQEKYGLFLFHSQGFVTVKYDEDTLKNSPVEKNIDIKIFKDVPLISSNVLEILLNKQKESPLNELENAKVKKFFLNKYSDIEPKFDNDDDLNEYWTEYLNYEYKRKDIQEAYELENYDKAYFMSKAQSNLLYSHKKLAKKELYDKVKGWFVSKGLKIENGLILTKEELREIYNLTEIMDHMGITKSKFNPECADRYISDRINAFFTSIVYGYKLEAGERKRDMINGKRVDNTTYILKGGAKTNYELIRKIV